MLKRVRIRGYKSLHDVEIRFGRPLTVIIGANAAGKSNFFDALALLSRMVTMRTLREAFDGHRGSDLEAFSYGAEGLPGLLQRPFAEFSIEVDLELSRSTIDSVDQQVAKMREGLPPGTAAVNGERAHESVSARRHVTERYLRYSLTVQISTDQGYLRVLDESLAALSANLERKKNRNPFVERTYDDRGGHRLSLRLEGQAHPTYYEVGLDYTLLSTPVYPPHYPHLVAAREEMSRWRFYYLEPRAMREQVPLRNVLALGPDGGDLAAFFNTMKVERPKQFEALRRALHLLVPQLQAFDVERTPDGFLQVVVRESGTEYSSRVISEGTLRMLALLAITNPIAATTLVGFEEPENGVHPRRLKLIADLLMQAAERKGIQILVNTHSPLLPRHFPEDELVLCRRVDSETVFEPLADVGLFREPAAIEDRLNAGEEPVTSVTDRIVRGDYGG